MAPWPRAAQDSEFRTLLPGCGPSGLTAWSSRWTHPLSCTCPASVASRPVCPHLLRKQKLQGLLWPCEALAWSDPVSPHSVDRLSPIPTRGNTTVLDNMNIVEIFKQWTNRPYLFSRRQCQGKYRMILSGKRWWAVGFLLRSLTL